VKPVEKALALAAIGLHVHPCRATDHAYVKNGVDRVAKAKTGYLPHGHLEATTDPDVIRRWWKKWPDALSGVAAGPSGLVCLDIDVDDEKDVDGWDSLAADELLPLPETIVYLTRRGGTHYVYKAPKDVKLDGVGGYRGMSGVDRRGGSSYFIWWGDHVPKSRKAFGNRPPAWLLDPANESVKAPFAGDNQEWLDGLDDGPIGYRARTALARATPESFKHGEGAHDAMRDRQRELVGLGAEHEPGIREALAELETIWKTVHKDDPDYLHDYDRSLVSAIKNYGEMKPRLELVADVVRKAAKAEPVDEPVVHEVTLVAKKKKKKKGKKTRLEDVLPEIEEPIKILRIADLLNRKAPDWWVEGLLQESTVAILAGEAGIGKSFLMLDIGCRIASGLDFHGRRVKQGRVLYVVAEGAASFGKRVVAWQQYYKTTVPEAEIGFVEQGVNLSDPESMVNLVKVLKREEPDVIILDTLSQLSSVENENDAAQLAAVLTTARSLRELRPGSTILIVHHVNKSDKGKVRGSSAIRGNADTVIVARPSEAGGSFSLSTEITDDGKQKDGVAEKFVGFQLLSMEGSAVVVKADITLLDKNRENEAIDRALEDFLPHTLTEILSEYGDMKDAARTKLRRALEPMIDAGFVTKTGEAPHVKYTRAKVSG
jgi:KaiC/GvpD/RAD55 family RecA-like ATPase